ncbi:MAG: AraC family transcriptional regulator [Steroidobacteraceae bacterium]
MRVPPSEALHAHEDLSAAPLVGLPALLEEFGVEPGPLLERFGLDPAVAGDPRARVSFEQVGRLLLACADISGCPHFGLLLGERAGTAASGDAALALAHAPTAGEALRSLAAHLHVNDRGGALSVARASRNQVRISYALFHPGTPGAAQIIDSVLAIMMAVMRQLCGPQWRPREVLLPRRYPADVSPYRACFRAPMRFDSAFAAIVFPASDLSRPLPGARAEERERLERIIAGIERERPVTASDQVVRVLARILMVAPPNGARVARALGVSRRRLHARLAAEGTRYSTLLADVRGEIARQLVEGTRMPLAEIATTLHYGSPGAFSRAYKAWTGVAPRTARARAAAGCDNPRPPRDGSYRPTDR